MTHLAEKRTTLLAIAMTMLLFILILMRWYSMHNMPSIQPVIPTLTSLKSSAVMAPIIQEAANSVIQSRPLFWQTRAPYVAPPPRQPKPKPFRAVKLGVDSFDKVKLSGMYTVGGETVLIVVGTEGSQRVRMGDDLAGWRFDSMTAEGAIFTQASEQRTLVMQKPTPPTKEELEKQAADIQARAERRALKAEVRGSSEQLKVETRADLEQLKAALEGVVAVEEAMPVAGSQTAPPKPQVIGKPAENDATVSFESISQRWKERSAATAKPAQ